MTEPRADSEMIRGVDFAGLGYQGLQNGKTPPVITAGAWRGMPNLGKSRR